jgi:hypothetical protein
LNDEAPPIVAARLIGASTPTDANTHSLAEAPMPDCDAAKKTLCERAAVAK